MIEQLSSHTHKHTHTHLYKYMDFPSNSMVKNTPVNAGDTRDAALIPGSGRSTGKGNGNLL